MRCSSSREAGASRPRRGEQRSPLVLQTKRFQRGYRFLVDQLNRAALSISANIAEDNGRFTKADRRNFFGIARDSVQECIPVTRARSPQTSDRYRHRQPGSSCPRRKRLAKAEEPDSLKLEGGIHACRMTL